MGEKKEPKIKYRLKEGMLDLDGWVGKRDRRPTDTDSRPHGANIEMCNFCNKLAVYEREEEGESDGDPASDYRRRMSEREGELARELTEIHRLILQIL